MRGSVEDDNVRVAWDESKNRITVGSNAVYAPPPLTLSYDDARTLFRALAYIFRPFDPRDYPEVR